MADSSTTRPAGDAEAPETVLRTRRRRVEAPPEGASTSESKPRRGRRGRSKDADPAPETAAPAAEASPPSPRSRRKREVVPQKGEGPLTVSDAGKASGGGDTSAEKPKRSRGRRRGRGRRKDAEAKAEQKAPVKKAAAASPQPPTPATPAAPAVKRLPSRIAQHLSTFSDRAIQRVTGGNAFLRGRLYARRGTVDELEAKGTDASAILQVKPDTIYHPKLTLTEDDQFVSDCDCPGFRGPTSHCKHVAALMVALRDRERPPRPKADPNAKKNGQGGQSKQEVAAHSPQTVSVGGKRRRSRRRRRGGGGGEGSSAIEVVNARDLGIQATDGRHADQWLPPENQLKTHELDFRMQVRSASIAITPVLAGSRSAVPIADLIGGFNAVSAEVRPLLRALSRNTTRGAPATAELRGEDAAEVLTMLRDQHVLLDPASMELRFQDEELKPRLELDMANAKAVRLRVVFESGSRRFPLSSGHWFEGTPGWHIDTTEGVARPISLAVTPAWLQRLYRSPAVVHAVQELPQLLTGYVPRVSASLGAPLPEIDEVADLVDATPDFTLRLDGDILEAKALLTVDYGEQSFPVPPATMPSPLEFLPPADGAETLRPRIVRRDVGSEMVAVQTLMNAGFEHDEEEDVLLARGDEAVAFWTEQIRELPEEWDVRAPDDLRQVRVRSGTVTPQLRVSSGVDWLSLDMAFGVDGVAVDTNELRACLEHGRHLVKLADGSFAPVEEDEVAEILERMAEIVAGAPNLDRLPLSQAGRVQDLMRLVGDSTVSPSAKALFTKLGDAGEIPQIAKPRNLKVAKFRDYQKRGFSWLVFLNTMGAGGILADDMGLGKTLQAIALIVWARNKHKPALNLVVAPTSVVPNWEREIQKFAPSMTTVVWQGSNRFDNESKLADADVMITSYALLRRDEEFLATLGFRYVILDEAQHIKNPMSATARAAKKLPSERRLALTGTPIENRLSEIWSIFDFVSPGLLGTLKSFDERYARPIDRGDEEAATKLRTIIHPLVLRRTKAEVAPELPPKIENDMVVPMADAQKALYQQMLKEVRDSVLSAVDKDGVSKSQIQILAALTRMRQVACDPRLTNLSGDWGVQTSAKLEALNEIMEEAVDGGHRVLIFSQFVKMLHLIRAELDEAGITYEYLDGSTKDRQERVDRFNEDDSIQAFLISLKAGGTGLNLTGADTVVHFDPWWNPAVEDQATDRAHRIGQTKTVSVYRLIARDSVEEKILELSAKKRELVSNVLTTESTPLKGLTRADIDDLFS